MSSFTRAVRVGDIAASARVELKFSGVEQGGPSFQGRVFLNDPEAAETTPRDPAHGYVGAFYVYGYGPAGPPAIREALAAKQQGAGAVAPIEKRLPVDGGAVRAAIDPTGTLLVTVVVIGSDNDAIIPDPPFEDVSVVVGRAG